MNLIDVECRVSCYGSIAVNAFMRNSLVTALVDETIASLTDMAAASYVREFDEGCRCRLYPVTPHVFTNGGARHPQQG